METRENLLKDGNFTTKEVWTADETSLGDFKVFSVMDLKSQSILGFVVSSEEGVGADEMIELIERIKGLLEEEGKVCGLPEIFHVDCSSVYRDKSLRDYLEDSKVAFSQAKGKLKNQNIEAFHSRLKFSVVIEMLKDKSKARLQAVFVLSKSQQSQNNKKKAGSKVIRNLLFTTDYFKTNGKDLIGKAIEIYNEGESGVYEKFSRGEIEFYLNRLAININYIGPPKGRVTQMVKSNQEHLLFDVQNTIKNVIETTP